ALWQLWRQGGLRDPRARFLLCWAVAAVVVFTPAEWKLRYYLLPWLPPLALLTGPLRAPLVQQPLVPLRVTPASVGVAALFAVAATAGTLIYFGRPDWLSASDRLPRPALLGAFGGGRATAAMIGVIVGIASVAIACRAWGGLVVLVAGAGFLWL